MLAVASAAAGGTLAAKEPTQAHANAAAWLEKALDMPDEDGDGTCGMSSTTQCTQHRRHTVRLATGGGCAEAINRCHVTHVSSTLRARMLHCLPTSHSLAAGRVAGVPRHRGRGAAVQCTGQRRAVGAASLDPATRGTGDAGAAAARRRAWVATSAQQSGRAVPPPSHNCPGRNSELAEIYLRV
jgi:hypothetical protein